jgi:hypothetical protein
MYVRFDSAIVLDYRSGIDDTVFADDRPRIHNYSWHYNSARSNTRRGSNDGSWVNERCGRETISEGVAEAPGAYAVVTHGNDKRDSGKAMQFLVPALEQAVAKGEASFRRVIVQERDALKTSGAPGRVQNHFPVAPSAPNQ